MQHNIIQQQQRFVNSNTDTYLDSELENSNNQNLYMKENDIGQSCISTRWVITKKVLHEETITKARLCTRGFEGNQEFRTDSPCCTRIGIRTALAVLTTNNWCLKAADVKTAFLQGKKIEQEVYIRPPKEAATNKVWKLCWQILVLTSQRRIN